jgi:hypothetical protein
MGMSFAAQFIYPFIVLAIFTAQAEAPLVIFADDPLSSIIAALKKMKERLMVGK